MLLRSGVDRVSSKSLNLLTEIYIRIILSVLYLSRPTTPNKFTHNNIFKGLDLFQEPETNKSRVKRKPKQCESFENVPGALRASQELCHCS